MDDLAARVQALPPELYNEIYELAFTPSFGTVYITPDYKPPSPLQVNKGLRKKFAIAYYGANREFVFDDTRLLHEWLTKLQNKHERLIRRITYADEWIKDTFLSPFNIWAIEWHINSKIEERRYQQMLKSTLVLDNEDEEDEEGDENLARTYMGPWVVY